MGVRLGTINKFDATDPEEVVCNLLNPGVLVRSHPSKIVARWKRYVRPENFRVYFFDDLKESPAELRRSILRFLGGDPNKPSGGLRPHENNDAGREKLRMTAKCATVWLNFLNRSSKPAPRSLVDGRKVGRRDTAFHCCCSSGTCWTTASISSSGGIGFADAASVPAFAKPKKK
jgi:hypothetical protein